MNHWRFALLAAGGITLAGFIVDFALGGRGFPAPAWPENGLLLASYLAFVVVVWLALRRTSWFAGLAGGRLAVVSLALVCVWALFLGSLPQVVRGEEAPIYQRVMQAPPFVFALFLLLANLCWGILKHLEGGLRPSSMFLFNHIGVLTVGLGTLFGAGDVARLDIWVREGEMAWTGTDGRQRYELPFAIDLHEFRREYFPPQITVIDAHSGEILLPKGDDPLTLREGKEADFFGHRIEVRELTDSAPWSVPGDPIPAAFVIATAPGGESAEGWISCGSHLMPPIFLGLGDISFAMPEPRSRLYESRLTVVLPDGPATEKTVRVNQPIKAAGWWLYQKGYNLEGGPGARFSQIEAVRDPWLPVVYTGFALMAIGALLGLGRAGSLLRRLPQTPPTPASS